MFDVPPTDIWRAILKEWYWIFIFAALVLVAFAPSFLKAKCPSCKKRKLRLMELDDQTASAIAQADATQFPSFFRCDACQSRFMRLRSGPLQDASDTKFAPAFAEKKSSISLPGT